MLTSGRGFGSNTSTDRRVIDVDNVIVVSFEDFNLLEEGGQGVF